MTEHLCPACGQDLSDADPWFHATGCNSGVPTKEEE